MKFITDVWFQESLRITYIDVSLFFLHKKKSNLSDFPELFLVM